MDTLLDELRQWIGRTEQSADSVMATPLKALAAALDREDPVPERGDEVPPCWHWLYFLPLHRQSELGSDGHARRGGFLPPVPLPRRMWAAGRLQWLRPLRVGEAVIRTSRIANVSIKEGCTGTLVFVSVQHEVADPAGPVLIEEQDIVYRDMPKPGEGVRPAAPAPVGRDWEREVVPDPVLLFRYSALTLNGHRIHYDRRYATEVEGYPGLVVHAPLIATLLLDLLRRNMPDVTISRFAFRALKPVFDIAPFTICGARVNDGKSIHLWAQTDGTLVIDATATVV